MLLLGIESSCDETSAAVLRDGRDIVSLAIASQIEEHRPFGGVVPELASRGHLKRILPIVDTAMRDAGATWDDLDAIAVTAGPGLVGSLLVGTEAAKTLAWLRDKPLLATNHLLGHADSIHLAMPAGRERRGDDAIARRVYPYLALVVSGGHTSLYRLNGPDAVATLGETRDDAVGEAYDKVAKLLGLGYPGGPVIDRRAAAGRADAFDLPRPMSGRDSFDFSYSGLKTAVLTIVKRLRAEGGADRHGGDGATLPDAMIDDLCASFQAAAIDVLIARLGRAISSTQVRRVAIVGGVACNSHLRERAARLAADLRADVFLPPPILCTDNAAMIAGHAWARLTDGDRRSWRDGIGSCRAGFDLNPRSSWPVAEPMGIS